MRVPGSFLGRGEAEDPPEQMTCLGAAPENHLTLHNRWPTQGDHN
jgi:hypothetical protein